MKKLEYIEKELEELKNIVYMFQRYAVAYSDTMLRIDGTLGELEDVGDIDEETVDYYVERVNEITKNMPPTQDMYDFLMKYCSDTDQDDEDLPDEIEF